MTTRWWVTIGWWRRSALDCLGGDWADQKRRQSRRTPKVLVAKSFSADPFLPLRRLDETSPVSLGAIPKHDSSGTALQLPADCFYPFRL